MTDALAAVAIFISLVSLFFSYLTLRRDTLRVRVSAKYLNGLYEDRPHILLEIVNIGRRPLIILKIGGIGSDNDWTATLERPEEGGIRLGEHERYVKKFYPEDIYSVTPDYIRTDFIKLFAQDSLGNNHIAEGSDTAIFQMKFK